MRGMFSPDEKKPLNGGSRLFGLAELLQR